MAHLQGGVYTLHDHTAKEPHSTARNLGEAIARGEAALSQAELVGAVAGQLARPTRGCPGPRGS